jgi:L-fucose isomerase-like protein
MEHQLIMKRCLEPDCEPNISRGTLEGALNVSDITLFRLQAAADCTLRSYVAQGEILDIDPKSFGTIGVFAVREMGRFYRHVLIEKRYPHHAGVAFAHVGKALFDFMKLMGISDIGYNQPNDKLYATENPF